MNASVTVVIPCFNQARFLRAAIDSARAGAIDPEIIVIDDGSTDDTMAVARSAGVSCIGQANRGLVNARNRGLDAAQGEFIVFLDADDALLPGALDTGVSALSEDPSRALTWGRCVTMDEYGVLLETPSPARVERDHHRALLTNNFIWSPAAAMMRTAAVREIGGFAGGFDAAADYDLYLRLARLHAAHDHGRVVAAYRRHGANMSGNAARMLRDTLAVMRRHRPHAAPDGMAWRRGRRMWKDFYGTQLVEEIRRDLRDRSAIEVVRKSMTLARLAPGVLWREVRKKTGVVARRTHAGRATPAAEISSPRRRADSASGN
jgi:glycosyltransferase involved in cell wall biosynthesis